MPDLINVHSNTNHLHVMQQDTYGGKSYVLSMSPHLEDDILWLRRFRQDQEKEAIARRENPELMRLYEEYRVLLKLTTDIP